MPIRKAVVCFLNVRIAKEIGSQTRAGLNGIPRLSATNDRLVPVGLKKPLSSRIGASFFETTFLDYRYSNVK